MSIPETSQIDVSNSQLASDITTTINNLPYEILAPIFQSLSLPKRNGIRAVCKRWKDIMDRMVGMEIRIGNFSEFDTLFKYDPSSDRTPVPVYHDFGIISQVGIESCLVGNISDPMASYVNFLGFLYGWIHTMRNFVFGPPKIPTFKSPELINSMHFNGHVSPVCFKVLTAELTNLTILTLHFATLNSLDEDSLKTIDFPTLETIVVRGGTQVYDTQHHIFIDWDTKIILRNLNMVVQNFYPSLKAVVIEYIYDMDHQLLINQSILEFLQRHASTLKRFKLQYSLLINQEFMHDDASVDEAILLAIGNTVKQTLRLNCLQIVPLCLSSLPYSSIWSPIINEQRSLQVFNIVGVLYRLDFIQRIIDLNFTEMRNLCVCRIVLFENLTPVQLDCCMFARCDNLRYLTLRGWTVTLSTKTLVNVGDLPKHLVQVDLGDMAIGTEEVRILALEMPELEKLELRFVGNKRDLGMDEDTLREIVRRRQLKECLLQRSFNGQLEQDGIFNGDSDNPDFISESVGGLLGFRMTKNGFYKRVSVGFDIY